MRAAICSVVLLPLCLSCYTRVLLHSNARDCIAFACLALASCVDRSSIIIYLFAFFWSAWKRGLISCVIERVNHLPLRHKRSLVSPSLCRGYVVVVRYLPSKFKVKIQIVIINLSIHSNFQSNPHSSLIIVRSLSRIILQKFEVSTGWYLHLRSRTIARLRRNTSNSREHKRQQEKADCGIGSYISPRTQKCYLILFQ